MFVVGVDGWTKIINSHPAFDGMKFLESEPEDDELPLYFECTIFTKDRKVATTVREYMYEVHTNQGAWEVQSVHFHAKGKLGTWKVVDLPLVDSDDIPLWLEHPLKEAIDVVAIPINLLQDIDIHGLELDLAKVDIFPMPAMPISVIGYPLGLAAGKSWPI